MYPARKNEIFRPDKQARYTIRGARDATKKDHLVDRKIKILPKKLGSIQYDIQEIQYA